MARMLHRCNTLLITHSGYTFKLSNPRHQNVHVILYWYACKYLRKLSCTSLNPMMVKPEFGLFFFSCLARLTQHSLDVSPWLTHKSIPFCHVQVDDVSDFDEHHFDHCRFYQWHTPTALIEDTLLNWV